MSDLATLQIRIQSLEASVADTRLKNLTKSGAKAERATDGLGKAFMRFAGPAAILAGAVGGMTKLVSTTREFDVLNAQLITATGSADKAAIAFEAITDFATSTPYDLAQVTEGFTKLVNLGLTPSERAMTSYGDTASAMGKDMNQMIEAVADAATGEFERLKEFGIRSKAEGDKVAFTFRGVTTTVGKNTQEIEEYMTKLGENNFAGAMSSRMDTLDGAISNLGDEWNKLWLNLSQQGAGDLIEDGVRMAIGALEDLNDLVASGELLAHIDAYISKFDGMGQDFAETLDILSALWEEFLTTGTAEDADSFLSFFNDAMVELPENARAMVQILTIELAHLAVVAAESGGAFVDNLKVVFERAAARAGVAGAQIKDALRFWDGDTFDYTTEMAKANESAAKKLAEIADASAARIAALNESRMDGISIALNEREVSVENYKIESAAAVKLGDKYDELKKKKAEANKGVDRTAGFGLGAKVKGPTDDETKAAEKRQKEYDDLVLSLRSEEEVIQQSYENRLAIILSNTEENSLKQQDLVTRLNADFATQALEGFIEEPNTFEGKAAKIQEEFELRRELVLNNTSMLEEERTALELELTEERNRQLAELEAQKQQQMLGNAAQIADGLAGIAKVTMGEQSTAYKAMFAVSKAFSIAQATMAIKDGIALAAESGPWPANLAAMASVAAATSTLVSDISSVTFSGAYDKGGVIQSGKVGLVGEFGPELVAGPANVRSRRETAAMFKEGGAEGEATPAPAPQTNIRIINSIDPSVMSDYLGSDAGEEIIMNAIKNNPETVRSVSNM
jgi:hypothetical protein